MLEYCVEYACNAKEVNDAQAESIKLMLEDLLYSSLASRLDVQDMEKFRKKVHEIRKIRLKLKTEKMQTLAHNAITNNNFYGNVGQMIGSSERVGCSNSDNMNLNGESEQQ